MPYFESNFLPSLSSLLYDLKLSQWVNSLKSWAISHIWWLYEDIGTLMMRMEMVPEMLVSLCYNLTLLIAQEDFIRLPFGQHKRTQKCHSCLSVGQWKETCSWQKKIGIWFLYHNRGYHVMDRYNDFNSWSAGIWMCLTENTFSWFATKKPNLESVNVHVISVLKCCLLWSRSPSKRLVRQTVPPPVEEKAKHVPPPARPPRPYDNKVTSLGAREPRRAWGEAAHPSDE